MLRIILFHIYCICFVSCNNQQRELQKVVEYWIGKEIKIPILQAKVEGKDTNYNDWRSKEFKILRYIDSVGCSSCRMHLYDWRKFFEEVKKEKLDIAIIFVLHIKDYRDFENLARENSFVYPVLYDPKGELDSLNHLPSNPALQTFLLDKNNRVVALGDPVRNKAIDSLYYRIITEKLGRKGAKAIHSEE